MESEIVLIEVCEEDVLFHRLSFCRNIIFYDNHYPAGNYPENLAFLVQSRLSELGNLFVLLAGLAISQYFIVRFIHGSRTMADDFFDYKEHYLNLQDMVQKIREQFGGKSHRNNNPAAQTKTYTIKRNTIFSGFAPVFVVES